MKSLRNVLAALSAVALVGLLAGCGKTTSPTAVTSDEAPPAAPIAVNVTIDSGTGMATLNWSDSPGNSVKSWHIFAYDPDPDRDEAYVEIGSTDAAVTSFLIPVSYQTGVQYFKVQGKNSSGNHSPFSYTVLANLSGPLSGTDSPLGHGGGHGRGRTD